MVVRRSRDQARFWTGGIEVFKMSDRGGVGGLLEAQYRVTTMRYLPQADVTVFPRLVEHPTTSSILKVESNGGRVWYGEIRSNGDEDGRFWATRDPYRCCVLFGASVYWFDIRDPGSIVGYRADHEWGGPVLFARSRDLLLFCGDPISAYGADGLHWRTGRVAFDDILEAAIDGDVLRGIANTYPEGSVPFTVDLVTGRLTGGFPGWEAFRVRRID